MRNLTKRAFFVLLIVLQAVLVVFACQSGTSNSEEATAVVLPKDTGYQRVWEYRYSPKEPVPGESSAAPWQPVVKFQGEMTCDWGPVTTEKFCVDVVEGFDMLCEVTEQLVICYGNWDEVTFGQFTATWCNEISGGEPICTHYDEALVDNVTGGEVFLARPVE